MRAMRQIAVHYSLDGIIRGAEIIDQETAAPELLAALEGLLRLRCLKVNLGDVPKFVKAARAAIAKATNQTTA